jgi:hypothetical protein
MKKHILIIILITVTNSKIFGQEYSFLVAGHLYGSPLSTNTVYPAKSLVSNTSFINTLKSSFFISLGDNCANGNDTTALRIFNESFARQIKIPIYTAYGNHDGNRSNIEKRTGKKTYFSFLKKSELFIFLDSELEDNTLNQESLNFFLITLSNAIVDTSIKNIFILSHKLIWSLSDEKYKKITDNSNDRKYRYDRYRKFYLNIKPLLDKASNTKDIYWISGDIGQPWSLPLFYEKDKKITFLATGLGDSPMDAILDFRVSDSKVNIIAYDLITHKSINYKNYNLTFWSNSFRKHLVIYRRVLQILDKHFFVGFIVGLFISLLIGIFIQKSQIRKKTY